MRLTRFAAIALSATALAAAGTPLAAGAATAHGTDQQTRAAAAPSAAVYNCWNQPQVRPSTFVVSCDGSSALTGLRWSAWNASIAVAAGVQWADTCEPNCAHGTWRHETVDLIFWRSRPVKGHPGERGYTQMTVLYPDSPTPGRPAVTSNTYTEFPPGSFPGEP
jgi:hypothetical protein